MAYRVPRNSVLGCVAALLLGSGPDAAAAPPPELTDAERAFAEQMRGARLVGRFTLGPGTQAKPERYDLGDVRKLPSGLWQFEARIRYADKDVTLPISLPVTFAGDTAVIAVNKVGFPPLGVYSARVLIHSGRYAGYWEGSGYGGHLFGKIERPPAGPAARRTTAEPAPTPGGP